MLPWQRGLVCAPPSQLCLPVALAKQLSGKQGLHGLFTFPNKLGSTLLPRRNCDTCCCQPTLLDLFNCSSIPALSSVA